MNVFAKFDEIPSKTLQDIKERKRHGHTFVRTDGQRENCIPSHKHSLRGRGYNDQNYYILKEIASRAILFTCSVFVDQEYHRTYGKNIAECMGYRRNRVIGIISLEGLFPSSIADTMNWFQNSMSDLNLFYTKAYRNQDFMVT